MSALGTYRGLLEQDRRQGDVDEEQYQDVKAELDRIEAKLSE
jgi:hypothetical protein